MHENVPAAVRNSMQLFIVGRSQQKCTIVSLRGAPDNVGNIVFLKNRF